MADERNVEFVVESRKSGKTDDEIFDEFEEAGYTPEEIKEIFDEANELVSPTAEPTEVEKNNRAEKKFPKKIKILLGLTVVLAIVCLVIYILG